MTYKDPVPTGRCARTVLFRLAAVALAAVSLPAFAAPAANTGTIEGRIVNAATGRSLSKAVVSIPGTNLQTLTDNFGNYELDNVPAGVANLKVAFAGQQPLAGAVTVSPGATVHQDFAFNSAVGEVTNGKRNVVTMGQYVVQSEKFQDAAEIAINEEKNSVNIKNVVSAGQFGDIPEGNIGEFVKYLPGVLINYGGQSYTSGADATAIQVRGFGPDLTAVTVDGMPITSTQAGSMTNAVSLDMLSINNASRIELTKVPTPDMPADSPGGSINLVSKNAFEYLHPTFDWRVYGSMNSEDTKIFKKEPGPGGKRTYHTLPGADFTFADPITHNFGIAITGASSNEFNENRRIQSKYNYSGNNTNLAGQKSYLNNPFLTQLQVTDGPRDSFRQSASLRADWRPTPGQTISATAQLSFYNSVDSARRLQLKAGNASDWGPDYTIGKVKSGQGGGQTITELDSGGRTKFGTLRYLLDHGPWKVTAAVSSSVSDGSYKSAGNGHFSEVDMDLNNVGQVNFKNVQNGIPATISVLDKNGNPIDYSQLSSYALSNLSSGGFTALTGLSYTRGTDNVYKLDVSRALDFIPERLMSLTVQAGYYREDKKTEKWGPGTGYGYQYVGPASAFDPTAYQDTIYTGISPGYGIQGMQWADPYKVYKFFQANPSYFSATTDDTTNGNSRAANNYISSVNQQIGVTQTKNAYYAMMTGRFFHNRLSTIFGARRESSSISGREPYQAKHWNYLKNPDGTLYFDSTYTKGVDMTNTKEFADTALHSRLAAAGITWDHVVNPRSLEAAQLQYIPNYPIHAKQTGRISPDASLSFDITQNLIAKFGWARTYAPVDLQSSNSLGAAAGLVERTSFTANTAADAFPAGTIDISNPNLKPWTADNYDLALNYYTNSGGSFQVDYYIKTIKNFWITNSVILDSNNYQDVLNSFGITPDPQYIDWQVNSATNGTGTGRTSGYEFTARQKLGAVARWLSPFMVFVNYSTSKLSQNQSAGAIGPSSRDYGSAGINFAWRRISATINMTHQNASSIGNYTAYYLDSTGAKQKATVYEYDPAVTRFDVDLNYQLTPRLSLFADGRNVTNSKLSQVQYDGLNVLPGYAHNYDTRDFGVQVTFGIRGTF